MSGQTPTVQGDAGPQQSRPVFVVDANGNTIAPLNADSVEVALRNGFSYLTSTPVVNVTSGERFYCLLRNPAGSGRAVFLYNRIFGNDRVPNDPELEYVAHINPTAVLGNTQNIANANGMIGLGNPSPCTFQYQVATDGAITMGGILATGELLPNGINYSRRVTVIIPPGGSVGFSIKGAGNTNFAARLSTVMEFWEEVV